jgi:hypothetical protein
VYNIPDINRQNLFLKTHEFIIGLLPELQAKIKYKIPFYSYHSDMCYLNAYKDHLYIGFNQGSFLMDRVCLDKTNTLSIAKYHVRNESDIFCDDLSEILLEAAMLNKIKKLK